MADHSLLSMLRNSVENWPERPALWVKDHTLNYQEFWDRANRIATAARAFRPESTLDGFESHLAIYAHKSISAYLGVLASLMSDMPYLPLNPRFPADRNARMIRETQANVWIVDERCADSAHSHLTEVEYSVLVIFPELSMLPEWCKDFKQHVFLCSPDLEKQVTSSPFSYPRQALGAYTLFTSGSTGIPKGVIVTLDNVVNYLDNISQLIEVLPTDRFTQISDLTFDLSVHDMFLCWKGGACLYVIPENAALFAARFVQENELTHWYSVPSTAVYLKQMGMLEADALPTLKYALFAGEAFSRELAKSFQSAACNAALYNLYGPTEATIVCIGYRWTKEDQDSPRDGNIPMGYALPNQEAVVVNDCGERVVDGELGELLIGGGQVAKGYYNNAVLTVEKFIKIPHLGYDDTVFYRTGDLVRNSADSGYEFHGRIDRQVKIRGFRVELQEIETALKAILELEEVGVIGVKENAQEGYTGILAYVATKGPLSKADENAILNECRKRLPDYMIPNSIKWLKELPLNANGKVDYKQLEAITDTPLSKV